MGEPPAEGDFDCLLQHQLNTQLDVVKVLAQPSLPLGTNYPAMIGIARLAKRLALLEEAHRSPDSLEVSSHCRTFSLHH